ncbi:MAG TPA: hypothetical protein VKE40_00985 [Gemmataceae bacterium]|nr:hypothetical protein [Gemmataceae bacterium]
MRSPPMTRLALLVAGLGLSVTIANAEPPKSGPGKVKDPVEKKVADPKPVPPVGLPKIDTKLPPLKVDPTPIVLLPKADPKPDPRPLPKTPVILPPMDPVKPPVIKPGFPIPAGPDPKSEVKTKPMDRPVLVHERPTVAGPVDLPKGPGLKLPKDVKFDRAELAKIKPPIDLSKTKPETVLATKPPTDFKVKPIKLDSIHVPHDAVTVEKLNLTTVTANQMFVVNKNDYTAGNYHLKFGTPLSSGLYCYLGKYHSHWHHCIWDPCFGCHYYYCPSTCCYYYWCATDYCYYPCYWFVDYGTCYYPWWICGGFGGYGYMGTPFVSIHIGW